MRPILHNSLLLIVLFILVAGCGDFFGRIGSRQLGDDVTNTQVYEAHQDESNDAGTPAPLSETDASEDDVEITDMEITDESIEIEELEMEDPEALAALILERLADHEKEETSWKSTTKPSDRVGVRAPPAYDNWRLTKKQCLARLNKEGIQFHEPDFITPLVTVPLLLDGPIGGVEIKPRWPTKAKRVNAIMDCHLVLALVETARQARILGIERILFYSTYRPIKTPPKSCKRGKTGSRCRRWKKAYRKKRKAPSQHGRALAIDIRWFITNKGETIDVLEHFDRRRRKSPCDYTASTDKGRILQSFACALHRNRIFNVMLTPNANKAHHNHFHFDITPDAKWYILR